MSSEMHIKETTSAGFPSARPQSHDTRFPERKPPNAFNRYGGSQNSEDNTPIVIKSIAFPVLLTKGPPIIPRPMSAAPAMTGGATGRVGASMITTAGQQQSIRERLVDWFTQYAVQPEVQVKQKSVPFNPRASRSPQSARSAISMSNNYQIFQGNLDITTLLDHQVCFMERSRQVNIIKQLSQRPGAIFTDSLFTPTWLSICGEYPWEREWTNITWNRMTTFPRASVFQGAIEPNDIRQGALGDCYYLAALAALAERPQRIRDILLTTEINQARFFSCKILYKGKWKEIIIDDFVPCYGQRPAFSHSIKNEMWVQILEKAWAKLYSSYKRIDAGFPEEGLHDLTGAHMKMFRFQVDTIDYENTWRYLLEANQKGYAMVGSTLPGSDQNIPVSGVILGHAYTVLGAFEIQYRGQLARLILCRNPWGTVESNLAWNDRDPRWRQVSPADIQRIGFNPNIDDGTFFLDFGDFIRNFRMLTSAEIDDNASYVYLTQPARDDRRKYFKVEIFREGDYSFQVNQIPDRRYPREYMAYYNYVDITLNIGKIVSPGRLEYYEGSQSNFRTLFKKHHLTPGVYIAFVEIQFNQGWETDYQITLAVYGSTVCRISAASKEETSHFHEALYLDRAYKTRQTYAPGIYYNMEILPEGFLYAAFFNSTSTPINLVGEIVNNPNKSVFLIDPDVPQRIDNAVQPNSSFILVARMYDARQPTSYLCNLAIRG